MRVYVWVWECGIIITIKLEFNYQGLIINHHFLSYSKRYSYSYNYDYNYNYLKRHPQEISQRGWGPEVWEVRRVGSAKILAFSLSRHNFSLFLNFGGVFEGRGPQMCTFGPRAVV